MKVKSLDLSHGRITNVGASLRPVMPLILLTCPEAKDLTKIIQSKAEIHAERIPKQLKKPNIYYEARFLETDLSGGIGYYIALQLYTER